MTCPTCNRAPQSPWRVYNEHGRAVMGCVDAYHTGHLLQGSESLRWHNRADAKKCRRALARYVRPFTPEYGARA